MVAEETIEEIVERIRERFDPDKIILFGSYAHGKPREDSDLDLLIVAETDLAPQERFPTVRRLLSDYPVSFDLILETPEEFCRHRSVVNHIAYFADKYGKILYERRDTRDREAMAAKSDK